MYADYFHISPGKRASGDMSAFGAAETRLSAEYDSPLRDETAFSPSVRSTPWTAFVWRKIRHIQYAPIS